MKRFERSIMIQLESTLAKMKIKLNNKLDEISRELGTSLMSKQILDYE